MIPLSTTTVTVLRNQPSSEGGTGFDEGVRDEKATLATGVRAHFSSPGFSDPTNAAPNVSMKLRTDPSDIAAGDTVVDEMTGETWYVQWANTRAQLIPNVVAQVWR